MDISYRVSFENSVSEVGRAEWNACAGTENPFVGHDFLTSLEESRCVGEQTGWIPNPVLVRDAKNGALLGAAPSYLKLHSKGEYMFDYHWADAYQRLEGESYYPKLQIAVPFTPVPGPRLLVDPSLPQPHQDSVRERLLQALVEKTERHELSSAHITFCTSEESEAACKRTRFLPRLGEQYHWFNHGYESWDDFLQDLTSRKRKNIKKERSKANSHPLEIVTVHGSEATTEQILKFFRMYQTTCMQKWGQPYLNLAFFQSLAEKLQDRLVLFLVRTQDNGQWVAGAWNLRGDSTLYGRNWGCLEHYDLLHFEVCYYRAIEYAIEHKLAKVEAGAQGMHKIGRGYRPQPVYSAHFIRAAGFRQAIEQYVHSEAEEIQYRLEALSRLEPFKNRGEDVP